MNWMTKLCVILMAIGGLNWGLVGLCGFDLVAFLFGPMSVLSRIIYTIVGVATIWAIIDCCSSSRNKNK